MTQRSILRRNCVRPLVISVDSDTDNLDVTPVKNKSEEDKGKKSVKTEHVEKKKVLKRKGKSVIESESESDYIESPVTKPKRKKIKSEPRTLSSKAVKKEIKPKPAVLEIKPEIVKKEAEDEPLAWEKINNKKSNLSKKKPKFEITWNEYDLLAEKENIEVHIAKNLVDLFETDNTIPFIARYRKHLTNNMSAEQLRGVRETYEEVCFCKSKAANIINAIDKIGKLTPYIKHSIMKCKSLDELDHVYAPFKTGSKRTLAERAKQLGLEECALAILNGTKYVHINSLIQPNGKEGLKTRDDVLKGLMHIIAHEIASNTDTLDFIRKLRSEIFLTIESKKSTSDKKQGDEKKFEIYFDGKFTSNFIKPHQILALNRGENLKVLTVKMNVPEIAHKQFSDFCHYKWIRGFYSDQDRLALFNQSVEDSYKRLVCPLIIRQTRSELNKKAEKASVEVFAMNLKKLLLQTPLKGKTILGIDPGYQKGCKAALISSLGEVLDTVVIYPHCKYKQDSPEVVKALLQKHNCSLIAIGNGTACRETETWLSDLIKMQFFTPLDVSYTIVDECGASIYSCSPEAKKEFSSMDPLLISAVSLARRVQDPLAELVKVDPQHLGVGMYQHDVNKKMLETSLNEVVLESVSFVGVDLNTASQCLLRRISGLTNIRAENIIKHRSKHGPFFNRYQIKDVKGIGDKVFEQCAGFLRVGPLNAEQAREFYQRPDANPLDCTWIHPESYSLTEKIIEKFGLNVSDVGQVQFIEHFSKSVLLNSPSSLASEFNASEATVKLILDALCKPLDHDLRNDKNHKPLFRKGVTSMSDVKIGMVLTGYVRNVTHFGAFVDIGVGVNGLIHTSKMYGYNIQLGDKVEVKVLDVDRDRQRISLTVEGIKY